jgi:hypothetical protein
MLRNKRTSIINLVNGYSTIVLGAHKTNLGNGLAWIRLRETGHSGTVTARPILSHTSRRFDS